MKKSLQLFVLFLFFFVGIRGLIAQNPTYLCELRNDVQIDTKTFEFDIYMLRTGATPFDWANAQYGLTVNASIKNGGTITAYFVTTTNGQATSNNTSGNCTSDYPFANQPNTITFAATQNCIKISGKTPTGTGSFYPSNVSPGSKVCRVRLVNTVDFGVFSPNLAWSFTTVPYKSQVLAYVSGISTDITVQASHTTSNLLNFVLNAPPTAYALTGGGNYCQGNPGLTLTLANSQTGVNYQLYQNTVISGSALPGSTGNPLTWNNIPAGSYTVVGTNTATLFFTQMNGTSTIVQTPASVGGAVSGSATITLGQSTGTLTLTGNTGTIVNWQSQLNGGGYADIPLTAGLASYSTTPGAVGTYDYRAVIQSGTCAMAQSTPATIIVNPAGPVAPTVLTNAATAVTASSATLNGTVTAGNDNTAVNFEYGTDLTYGTIVPATLGSLSGNTATAVHADISGLTTGLTYHFRCFATNSVTRSNGGDMQFLATACPLPDAPGAISGPINVCSTIGGYVYSVPVIANADSYVWAYSGTGATFVNGGSSITVTFSPTATSGNFTVYGHSNTCGDGTISSNYNVTVNALPVPTIAGPASPCVNSTTNVYTTQPGMTGYTWTVSTGGAILSGGTTNAITVSWGTTGAKTVTVNYTNGAGCTATTATSYPVTVNALPTPTIAGPAAVCVGSTTSVYTTQTGMTGYTWTVSAGGAITTGAGTSSITVTWSVAGSQTVSVNYTNAGLCTAAAATIYPVTVNVLPVPAVGGPATACIGSTTNVYSTALGMTGYTWTVSAGGAITAGTGTSSITVTWSTLGAKTVTVNFTNSNGCSATTPTSYPVTVVALPVPTITGPATSCAGSTGIVYTTQTGMSGYTWTISAGGQITAGAGTSSVTVKWNTAGAQTISVNYANTNGCTATTPTSYPVTITVTSSPVITGTSNLCINSGFYDYVTEPGMTNYTWTVSAGGTITFGAGTNDLQVTWHAAGAQNVSVNYTNPSGCSSALATNFPVTVNPIPGSAGNITGTATVCGGASGVAYSTPAVTNATAYAWTFPAGATIASGNGTNNITVNFAPNASSGVVTVAGNNVCGNGTLSSPFTLTANPLPAPAGTITGLTAVCEGTSGVVYSVATITGATSYAWTVPTGVNIVSGANTNSITVNFTASAVTGIIAVHGSNACGAGGPSNPFTVTVNAIPTTPVITAVGPVLTSSSATGNKWFKDGVSIAGANGQTYTALHTGWYWTVVSINNCSSDTSNHIYILFDGVNTLQSSKIELYPVPNDGIFKVSITSPTATKFTMVVYNNLGSGIYEEKNIEVNGTFEKTIDLRPIPDGVYTVAFRNSDGQVIRRIVVKQ